MWQKIFQKMQKNAQSANLVVHKMDVNIYQKMHDKKIKSHLRSHLTSHSSHITSHVTLFSLFLIIISKFDSERIEWEMIQQLNNMYKRIQHYLIVESFLIQFFQNRISKWCLDKRRVWRDARDISRTCTRNFVLEITFCMEKDRKCDKKFFKKCKKMHKVQI